MARIIGRERSFLSLGIMTMLLGCASSGAAGEGHESTYSIQEFGLSVTLPQSYGWRASAFQFGWGPGTVAEWFSGEQWVGGLWHHHELSMDVDKYANRTEDVARSAKSMKSLKRVKEHLWAGREGGPWLIREYEENWDGTLLILVIAFNSLGRHNFGVAQWCPKDRWSEKKKGIYRTIHSLECLGPPPPAFTGIYSLQAIIDFDALDGVAIDPVTGTISLFGHRSRSGRRSSIAYLDHLATAMECDSPTLDLRWVPNSEVEINRALNISDESLDTKLTRLYDGNGRLLPLGEWWYRLGGAEAKVGMTRYQANAAALRATGHASDATVLLILEKREECLNNNQSEQADAFLRLLYKQLGIFDKAEELYRQSQQGKITETQYLDGSLAMYLGAVAKVFGQNPQAYENGYREERRKGVQPQQAAENVTATMVSPENQKRWLRQVLFVELFRNISDLHLPYSEASRVLGVVPRVYPKFENLPPRSLMARVAFEADILGKKLMVMPELKRQIPRYRTFFEWRRTVPTAAGDKEGHLWFSPDGFELRESTDGNVVQFGRAAVRIHLRRKEGGKSVEDPVLQKYADELTSLYDDIANEYPVLHELRECMKVVAVAGWLKQHGVHLSFPAEGRVYWNPPKEAPGIVEIVIAAKEGPVGMMIWALGGVDFDGRYAHGGTPAWNLQKSAAVDAIPVKNMVVPSLKQTNETLSKYKIDTIDVPMPWIYGEVPADAGRRAMKYVSFQEKELAAQTDSAGALLQLAKVRRKAELLVGYDRMLNARAKERSEAKKDLAELVEDAKSAMRDIVTELRDLILSVGLGSADLGEIFKSEKTPSKEVLEAAGKLEEYRALLEDLKKAIEGFSKGEFDSDYWGHISERLSEAGIELRQRLMKLSGASPRVADYITTRTEMYIQVVYGGGKIAIATGELFKLHDMVSDVSDQLGKQAIDGEELLKRRKACLDDYVREKRILEEMRKK